MRARLIGLLCGGLLVGAVTAELLTRVAIALRVPFFRRPGLYVAERDDDFWKLTYLWAEGPRGPRAGRPDLILGWSPPATPENPLGLTDAICAPAIADRETGRVAFYGDSFVAGATQCEDNVARQLDALLPGDAVLNLGVGGYGTDQVLLRLQRTLAAARPTVVLLGVLTYDLDRALLTVRTGPKPYFVERNGTLAMEGTPLPLDHAAWYADHPPAVGSFFLNAVRLRWELLRAGGDWAEVGVRRADIERVNRSILAAAVEETRRAHVPLVAVLFYSPKEVSSPGWRETFLKERFASLAVPTVDTKSLLLAAAGSPAQYYLPDGHLGIPGNALVAAGIAAQLRTLALVQ